QGEVSFIGSNVQAQLMMNGEFVTRVLTAEEGVVRKVVTRHRYAEMPTVRDLYLQALNRPPSDAEARRMLGAFKLTWKEPDALAPWQDLFWALLNSSEFALNR